MSIFSQYRSRYADSQEEELSLEDYLRLCRDDASAYASPAERMLAAIGEPELVDTRQDPRLSRIFSNKIIKRYPAFDEFYGMEETIEQIVSFFRHAAQGLEEKKQILYLLDPVGGGKSSLAERLKVLVEQQPFYALKGSPVNESPLGLFSPCEDAHILEEEFGIPRRHLTGLMSSWAVKRLREFGGDITQFRVVRLRPSSLRQIAVAKTELGDENNQDISSLVGKVDIRKLEHYAQDDPDAYSYSGGLCLANRGLLELVEMFKAPIKVLQPLLTATQEGNYKGAEGLAAIPFEGVILAHSNESEWTSFKNNRNNEAFLDRIHIVNVPHRVACAEERGRRPAGEVEPEAAAPPFCLQVVDLVILAAAAGTEVGSPRTIRDLHTEVSARIASRCKGGLRIKAARSTLYARCIALVEAGLLRAACYRRRSVPVYNTDRGIETMRLFEVLIE